MFLFSLVEISESPQSFVPVPICGVTRVASLKGTFFSDTLIFGWRKHGFLWIFPSTDPTELRPLYGRYHQVCFVKTPFLDVSCEYLTYHILSHPITKKTYMTFTQAMGCSGLSSRSASSARHAEPEDPQMPWANSFTPGLGRQ